MSRHATRAVRRGGPRVTNSLETGREAVAKHDWPDAVEALTAADRESPLGAADLELLGNALWWDARPDDSNEALERAFNAFVEDGRPAEAAWVAMTLGYQASRALNEAVGGGWFARAERLLAD